MSVELMVCCSKRPHQHPNPYLYLHSHPRRAETLIGALEGLSPALLALVYCCLLASPHSATTMQYPNLDRDHGYIWEVEEVEVRHPYERLVSPCLPWVDQTQTTYENCVEIDADAFRGGPKCWEAAELLTTHAEYPYSLKVL